MNEQVQTAALQPRLSAGAATHGVDASAMLPLLFRSFDGHLPLRLAPASGWCTCRSTTSLPVASTLAHPEEHSLNIDRDPTAFARSDCRVCIVAGDRARPLHERTSIKRAQGGSIAACDSSAHAMSAKPPVQQLDAALSRWENEGGARSRKPQTGPRTPCQIRQAMNTELEHLHIRMIAMENLLIALLSQSPDGQLELGSEMAAYISPRPGSTHHTRTVGATAQMLHLVERARHFQGWVEGDVLL